MKGELTFKGSNKSIKILEMDYSFNQEFDYHTGNVTGHPIGGLINLVLEMSAENGMILQWVLGTLDKKDGKITVYVKDNVKREIVFNNASCVNYDESFDYRGGDEPMSYRITILVEELEIASQGASVSYNFPYAGKE